MRYLLIWADYMGTGIRDEAASRFIDPSELGLDETLRKRILDWVNRYGRITPLDEHERDLERGTIEALDEEGLDIARAVRDSLSEGVRITYVSEGTLKRLTV